MSESFIANAQNLQMTVRNQVQKHNSNVIVLIAETHFKIGENEANLFCFNLKYFYATYLHIFVSLSIGNL